VAECVNGDERVCGFTLFILAMLALDLGLFQRRPHVVGVKEALGWFGVWSGLALIFNVGVVFFHERGTEPPARGCPRSPPHWAQIVPNQEGAVQPICGFVSWRRVG
jgi:hypothetical protein